MKRTLTILKLAAVLIIPSSLLYSLHLFIFKNPRDVMFYTLMDIAFMPLQVFLTTFVLDTVMEGRAREDRIAKLSSVIGAFFSKVGHDTLALFSSLDQNAEARSLAARPDGTWTKADFALARSRLSSIGCRIRLTHDDLARLKELLFPGRDTLIRLLENPNLLEHESFADCILALFHVVDELEARPEGLDLPEPDMAHLSNDVARALGLLSAEWLEHARRLKKEYPYLYSLAIRKNPFIPGMDPIIRAPS